MAESLPEEIQRGVAELLAVHQTRTWRLLLTHHVPDGNGRCTACALASQRGPRWPCTLRLVAEEAQRLSAAARPEAHSS